MKSGYFVFPKNNSMPVFETEKFLICMYVIGFEQFFLSL